ncbi:MAG: ABC transporter ATP-binding protein [Verrucomicrobia bacterium]|nr:MAG: ABC transporter ATP-binding protein [Verrucomicrobiota bacterium]
MSLLDVRHLTTRFHTRNGIVHAVEDVSFQVEPGQTLGIVGESGCGKSVTCYSLLGLIPTPPGRIHSGEAWFDGVDLLKLSAKELRAIRGKRIGMIFQDPMTSLNPYMSVKDQLIEPLLIHQKISNKKAVSQAITALEEVGIQDAEKRIHSFPHEFSGGMRQRVMIAMAMITRPQLLICDEPTTALDVTVQKQVLDLIREQQTKLGTAVILITHDLSVVSEVCDRIHVMYAGQIVESADKQALFRRPAHAYTRSLLKAIPATHSKNEVLFSIPGLPPNLTDEMQGCSFRMRNTLGNAAACKTTGKVGMIEVETGHWAQDCPGCLCK